MDEQEYIHVPNPRNANLTMCIIRGFTWRVHVLIHRQSAIHSHCITSTVAYGDKCHFPWYNDFPLVDNATAHLHGSPVHLSWGPPPDVVPWKLDELFIPGQSV